MKNKNGSILLVNNNLEIDFEIINQEIYTFKIINI